MSNDTSGKRGKSRGSARKTTGVLETGFEGISSDLAGSGEDRRAISSFTGSGEDR